MRTNGNCVARVELAITERFLYRDVLVNKVWVRLRAGQRRSNAVHYSGVDFYNDHRTITGRMPATNLPDEVHVALAGVIDGFPSLKP